MAEAMLFSLICMIVGGFLGVASTIMLVSLPDGMPRSIKEAWVQVPQYRKAMICAILGLIFVLFGVILSLSY